MLERAQEGTREGQYTHVAYVRFADALLLFVDGHRRHDWLLRAVEQRLRHELATLPVTLHEDKSRLVDLAKGERVGFLGFALRRRRRRKGPWGPSDAPQMTQRTALLRRLQTMFRDARSQPIARGIHQINPILRGWVHYVAIGHVRRCFSYGQNWVAKKIRRPLMRARQREGFGWKRWRRQGLSRHLGLFGTSHVARPQPLRLQALPAGEVASPLGRSGQGCVVREIRMLRATWRKLETE